MLGALPQQKKLLHSSVVILMVILHSVGTHICHTSDELEAKECPNAVPNGLAEAMSKAQEAT